MRARDERWLAQLARPARIAFRQAPRDCAPSPCCFQPCRCRNTLPTLRPPPSAACWRPFARARNLTCTHGRALLRRLPALCSETSITLSVDRGKQSRMASFLSGRVGLVLL